MNNPFDFGYVFSTPVDFGPYALTFFLISIIGTAVANFMFFSGKYRFKNNLLTYTLVNRASRAAAIGFTLAFVFFLCRIARLQPFNARLFLDIALVLLIVYAVRGIGYMLRTYPKAKAEWLGRREKLQPRGAAAIKPASASVQVAKAAPAKAIATAATGSLATSSADAGGDDSTAESRAAAQVAAARRELSERGQKRRERKRNKR